jgi:APA family basic amino acid/polyamine antiporter
MAVGKPVKLKRELNFWKATICGVGVILGAGIYVLIGKAAALSGNSLWLAFVIGGILAGLTGLSYAELSSIWPKAGAEYEYVKHTFGKKLAFLVAWLIIVGSIFGAATVSLGFGGYIFSLTGFAIIPAAILLIIAIGFVIFLGIKESAWLAIIFAVIETMGLIFIIATSLPAFGSVNYFEIPNFRNIFGAAALIFFAYLGFEELPRLSEETKKPKTVIPRAVLTSITISTIIYILVSIAAVSVLDWHILAQSPAPLADVAKLTFGSSAFYILSIIAAIATASTVLIFMLATSRMLYGMGGQVLPASFALIHKKRRTPWLAITILTIFSMLAVLPGQIEAVASLTDFAVFFTFIVINLAVIWLRYKSPYIDRHFKVPLSIARFPILPAAGAATSAFMMASLRPDILVYGLILIVIGAIIYKYK